MKIKTKTLILEILTVISLTASACGKSETADIPAPDPTVTPEETQETEPQEIVPEDDGSYFNASATGTFGEDTNIIFYYFPGEKTDDDVLLYRNDKQPIPMYDDGTHNDDVPDDGEYTISVFVSGDTDKDPDTFYAATSSHKSNEIVIGHYDKADPEIVMSEYSQVNDALNTAVADYLDSEGYVKEDDVSSLYDDVLKIGEDLKKNGQIIDVTDTGYNIRFTLNSGINAYYVAPVEGVKSMPAVETYQVAFKGTPSDDDFTDGTAIKLQETLGYEFAGDYDGAMANLTNLSQTTGNNIIIWSGHGCYDPQYGPYLITIESFGTFLKNGFDGDKLLLLDGIPDGNGNIVNSTRKIGISGKTIRKYLGRIDGSFIFLNTCYSAQDRRLVNAFLALGADAVVANKSSIGVDYSNNMGIEIFDQLMSIDPDTGDYTVLGAAVAKAKAKYGDREPIYHFQRYNDSTRRAEVFYFGDPVYQLKKSAPLGYVGYTDKPIRGDNPIRGAANGDLILVVDDVHNRILLDEATVSSFSIGTTYEFDAEHNLICVDITEEGYWFSESDKVNSTDWLEKIEKMEMGEIDDIVPDYIYLVKYNETAGLYETVVYDRYVMQNEASTPVYDVASLGSAEYTISPNCIFIERGWYDDEIEGTYTVNDVDLNEFMHVGEGRHQIRFFCNATGQVIELQSLPAGEVD